MAHKCCLKYSIHEGTPQGEWKELGGYKAYFAWPENKSTDYTIVMMADGMGPYFQNTQLLADEFAKNGYFVVIPDLLRGEPVPLDVNVETFDFQGWFMNGPKGSHTPENIDPVVAAAIKDLRSQYTIKRLGGIGYCFGGKYACRFLGATGKEHGTMFDVAFAATPSPWTKEELQTIEGPFSIAAAEQDPIWPVEARHETEAVLTELGQANRNIAYQITLYGAAAHGFGTKADLSDRRQRWAKDGAFVQSLMWMEEYLKEDSEKQ